LLNRRIICVTPGDTFAELSAANHKFRPKRLLRPPPVTVTANRLADHHAIRNVSDGASPPLLPFLPRALRGVHWRDRRPFLAYHAHLKGARAIQRIRILDHGGAACSQGHQPKGHHWVRNQTSCHCSSSEHQRRLHARSVWYSRSQWEGAAER
jgi:hypothetical protein